MANRITSIATHKVGNVTITLVLDKRTNKNTDKYPLSVCFNTMENGKQRRYYLHLGDYTTEKHFSEQSSCSTMVESC